MEISKLLSDTIAKTAGTVMTGLDGLFTSDDERNKAKAVIEKAFNEMLAILTALVVAMQKERTERHKNDMQSDSWLSKNIRPLSLIFLTALYTLLVIWDSCTPELIEYVVNKEGINSVESLTKDSFSVADKYVSLLENLMLAAYGFYFTSRGFEKIAQAVKAMRSNTINVE